MSKSAEGAELLTEQNRVHSNHGVTRMGMTRTCQVNLTWFEHGRWSSPIELRFDRSTMLPPTHSPKRPAISPPPPPSRSPFLPLPSLDWPPSRTTSTICSPPASSLRYTLWPLPRPPSFCCSQLPVSWVAITIPTLAGRFYVIACGPYFYPARQGPSRPVHIPPFIYL